MHVAERIETTNFPEILHLQVIGGLDMLFAMIAQSYSTNGLFLKQLENYSC